MTDAYPRHIMLIAGEPSGDRHGANLINSIKIKDPHIRITGLGGPLMRREGQKQLYNIKELAVLGLTEVLRKIFFFKKVFRDTLDFVRIEKPDALVLIDYPGFNLRLAEAVRRIENRVKIIYYISPQVWAWGRGRVKKIGRVIDKMLVVFHFEKYIYEEEGIPVSFVGHPLMDELKIDISREESRKVLGIPSEGPVIGILPGSRMQEIKLILPVMLNVVYLLKKKYRASFVLPLASGIERKFVENIIHGAGIEQIKIFVRKTPQVIASSDLIITASGTATLEAGILNRPMIIIYKVPLLSYMVLRRIIKLPYIGMVNILLNEEVCPEFIQYKARAFDIFRACSNILDNKDYQKSITERLKKLQSILGGPGAGIRAAQEVWEVVYG